MDTEILLFQVDEKTFGLPCESVKEVVRAVKLCPLSQPSKLVEGLLNLRGALLPVLDVRSMFRLPLRDIRHTDHLIVTKAAGQMLTLRVDQALELVRLDNDDLKPGQMLLSESAFVQAVANVGDRVVYVLDVERVVAMYGSTLLHEAKSAEASQ